MFLLRGLSVWLLVGAALTGCGRGHPDYFGTIRPLHPPDEVWINNSTEPEWIDPGKCSDSTGGEIIWNTFAGLTEFHPESLQPMPDVAKSWIVSEEGTRFTFTLRESKWSDGKALTAHDFEWSWKRVLDPKTASKYSILLYLVRHGAPFNQKALLLEGVPESTTDDAIKEWVEAVVPVDKITRSGELTFAFVAEPEEDAEGAQATVSRDDAVRQLNGRSLDAASIQVRVTDSSVVGVRAVDDSTLVVDLEYPATYFLSLTSFYTYMPVPRHVIEGLEAAGKNPDLWTRTDNIVSNGPYTLKEWRFRQYMLFERNDHYWNVDAPHLCRIKTVKTPMVESYNTCLNLYCAGEVDWTGGQTMVPSEFIDKMKAYQDFDNSRYLGVYFYWINTTEPPTDNPLVRKALSLALDREKITSFVARGGQIPISTVVPDGLAGYDGLDEPLFDPDGARQALADAGYPNGEGLPTITLIYNTTEMHKQIASAAQQMWKDNLGIHVNIENQEWKVYLSRLQRMEFQIARMGWIGDYADPNTFLELFASNNGNNHSNWANEQYDRMLEDANKTVDPSERLKKLRAAEAHAMQQQPVIPIYVYTKSSMVKPYLKGYFPNDMDRHQWKYFWIDEDWYNGKPDTVGNNPIPPVVPLED